MTPELRRSYAAAERVTAAWAKSFYFASRFLPRPKRRAVFALYDYCRHVDNLVDLRGARPVEAVHDELAALAATVRALHAGAAPDGPRWLALADTLRRRDVPLAPLLELLDGVALDLEPVAMRTRVELERYCRLVAGGVGLMLGPVLGAEPNRFTEIGVGLGIAMQLTNILRDIAEDLDQGRYYLPAEELVRYGLDHAALAGAHAAQRATPALRAYVRAEVVRARRLFAQADEIVELFPRDGSRLTVRLLQRTYAGILDEIARRDYDPFRGRVYVSTARKLVILGRAVLHEGPRPLLRLSEGAA